METDAGCNYENERMYIIVEEVDLVFRPLSKESHLGSLYINIYLDEPFTNGYFTNIDPITVLVYI